MPSRVKEPLTPDAAKSGGGHKAKNNAAATHRSGNPSSTDAVLSCWRSTSGRWRCLGQCNCRSDWYARRRQVAISPAFPRADHQSTAMYKARDRSNDLCRVKTTDRCKPAKHLPKFRGQVSVIQFRRRDHLDAAFNKPLEIGIVFCVLERAHALQKNFLKCRRRLSETAANH